MCVVRAESLSNAQRKCCEIKFTHKPSLMTKPTNRTETRRRRSGKGRSQDVGRNVWLAGLHSAGLEIV